MALGDLETIKRRRQGVSCFIDGNSHRRLRRELPGLTRRLEHHSPAAPQAGLPPTALFSEGSADPPQKPCPTCRQPAHHLNTPAWRVICTLNSRAPRLAPGTCGREQTPGMKVLGDGQPGRRRCPSNASASANIPGRSGSRANPRRTHGAVAVPAQLAGNGAATVAEGRGEQVVLARSRAFRQQRHCWFRERRPGVDGSRRRDEGRGCLTATSDSFASADTTPPLALVREQVPGWTAAGLTGVHPSRGVGTAATSLRRGDQRGRSSAAGASLGLRINKPASASSLPTAHRLAIEAHQQPGPARLPASGGRPLAATRARHAGLAHASTRASAAPIQTEQRRRAALPFHQHRGGIGGADSTLAGGSATMREDGSCSFQVKD